MCSLAPFALPARCFFGPVAAPPRRTMTMAAYAVVEAPLPAPVPPCCYEYDAVEIQGVFRDINDACFLDKPPIPVDAPACTAGFSNTKSTEASKKKKRPPDEPNWTYDADIDATLREKEKDPAERPSGDYLWTTQGMAMTMADRAELVTWMCEFSRRFLHGGLARETLHRAVSYVDRFLSAKKMDGDDLRLLGAAAVFTASKYEDRKTVLILNADDVAGAVGCTRRHVLAAERDLVAVLGYRLGGPTAYTFVEHFTRHDDETDGRMAMIRSVAHHLADTTLLDFRCVSFLPSAVATAAVLLARRVVVASEYEEELLEMTGYTLDDLTEIIDVIHDTHDLEGV